MEWRVIEGRWEKGIECLMPCSQLSSTNTELKQIKPFLFFLCTLPLAHFTLLFCSFTLSLVHSSIFLLFIFHFSQGRGEDAPPGCHLNLNLNLNINSKKEKVKREDAPLGCHMPVSCSIITDLNLYLN